VTARNRSGRRWRVAILTVLALVVNVPVLAVVINSLKSTEEFLSSNSLLPERWTLANYGLLSLHINYPSLVRTSLIVALSATLVTTVVAALAGYGLSRSRARLPAAYARATLILQMFPHLLALVPLFILFASLGLINTVLSVIPLYVGAALPYGIWMAKGFYDSIPRDLEEAAWVDGCSPARAFAQVVAPLSGPGLAAIGIYAFLLSWNEFLIASVFLRNPSTQTIPIGIFSFVQEYQTDWGPLFAASALTLIPAFVFVVFAQRYLVQSTLTGSLKG
jgi:ABC-type glycerol-3-phosphate transport system permease component